jgi:hypothetical protein
MQHVPQNFLSPSRPGENNGLDYIFIKFLLCHDDIF